VGVSRHRQGSRRVYRKTWTNPAPEKPIASFDFVSTKREAAPFLVGATAE
jgi:hypothetical protein